MILFQGIFAVSTNLVPTSIISCLDHYSNIQLSCLWAWAALQLSLHFASEKFLKTQLWSTAFFLPKTYKWFLTLWVKCRVPDQTHPLFSLIPASCSSLWLCVTQASFLNGTRPLFPTTEPLYVLFLGLDALPLSNQHFSWLVSIHLSSLGMEGLPLYSSVDQVHPCSWHPIIFPHSS